MCINTTGDTFDTFNSQMDVIIYSLWLSLADRSVYMDECAVSDVVLFGFELHRICKRLIGICIGHVQSIIYHLRLCWGTCA